MMARYEIKKVTRPIWDSERCKTKWKTQYDVVERRNSKMFAMAITAAIAFIVAMAFDIIETPESWILIAATIGIVAGVVLTLSPSPTFDDETFDTEECAEEYKNYLEAKEVRE